MTQTPGPTPTGASAPPAAPPASGTSEPMKKPGAWLWFWIKTAAVVTVVGICLIVGMGLLIWHKLATTPLYWVNNQEYLKQTPTLEVKRTADEFERRTLGIVSSPGPQSPDGTTEGVGQTTQLTVELKDVNAWLNANLQAWLAHKNITLPPGPDKFMIATEDGKLLLACTYDKVNKGSVVTAVFDVKIQPSGKAFIQLQSMRVGTMTLPAAVIGELLPPSNNGTNNGVEVIRELIEGTQRDPTMHIDSTRQVRVTGLAVQDDSLIVTFKTEKRE